MTPNRFTPFRFAEKRENRVREPAMREMQERKNQPYDDDFQNYRFPSVVHELLPSKKLVDYFIRS
jgi:hypothetical protein